MRSDTSSDPPWDADPWPDSPDDLSRLQEEISRRAGACLEADGWTATDQAVVAGCFAVFAPARYPARNDRAWAGAVAWRPATVPTRRGLPWRRPDPVLRGTTARHGPRRATDIDAQAVVAGQAGDVYRPGHLALRQGRLLEAAVAALEVRPDAVLVDATGLDHPRGAGLAVHLGAVLGLPTVGVTDRSLVARGDRPLPVRGARSPALVDDRVVGYWVCTRTGARPVLAHAGWRTDPVEAAATVLLCSTEAARTPVPLQEARRLARESRAAALGTRST